MLPSTTGLAGSSDPAGVAPVEIAPPPTLPPRATDERQARRNAPGTARDIALTRRFVYITTGPGTHTRAYRVRVRAL